MMTRFCTFNCAAIVRARASRFISSTAGIKGGATGEESAGECRFQEERRFSLDTSSGSLGRIVLDSSDPRLEIRSLRR